MDGLGEPLFPPSRAKWMPEGMSEYHWKRASLWHRLGHRASYATRWLGTNHVIAYCLVLIVPPALAFMYYYPQRMTWWTRLQFKPKTYPHLAHTKIPMQD